MKNYPFSFNQLKSFSESNPYLTLEGEELALYEYLKAAEKRLNFPAVTDDIGNFLKFLTHFISPRIIFEFGSGYGQSAFWYLLGSASVEKIHLCEKRTDLVEVFEGAPWSAKQRAMLDYFQGDAFDRFEDLKTVDMLLIDGVKADYLRFLELSHSKMSENSLVVIDNSYWRGSFLDEELSQTKQSAKNIKELHAYIRASGKWDSVFIPFVDGLTLLRPLF